MTDPDRSGQDASGPPSSAPISEGEWSGGKVQGIRLLQVSWPNDLIKGVAVLSDGTRLQGKEALKACSAHGASDPNLLAALTLLFLERGESPVLDVSTQSGPSGNLSADLSVDQAKLVHAPAVHHDTLELWFRERRTNILMRGQLNLKTFDYDRMPIGNVMNAGRDPFDIVRQQIDGPGDQASPIRAIVSSQRNNPRTIPFLVDVALNAGYPNARKEACRMLQVVHDATVVKPLTAILLRDQFPEVRAEAAVTLAILKDPSARSALQQAAQNDADATVRANSASALKSLD